MPRPTDNVEWAPNADADDVAEPTAERDRGYQDGEDLPNEQLNWLLRALGAWVQYFDDQFNGATGLIDFFTGIAFGDNGDWTKNVDDANDYEAEMTHTGSGDATLVADVFRANSTLESSELRGVSADEIDLQATSGSSGNGGFHLKFLRGGAQDAGEQGLNMVDVRDDTEAFGSGGIAVDRIHAGTQDPIDVLASTGTIGGGSLRLDALVPGNVDDQIDVDAENGDSRDGLVMARNVVRAHGLVSGITTPPSRGSVGIDGVSFDGTDWVLNLSDTTSTAVVVATINESTSFVEDPGDFTGISIVAEYDSSQNAARVTTRDNTGAVTSDIGFNYHICYVSDG